jgi:hypothetical protein
MTHTSTSSITALFALAFGACGDASLEAMLAPERGAIGGALAAANAPTRPSPTGKGIGTLATTGVPRTRYKIEYQSWGSIMQDATNVYFIWYGNWSGDPAVNILTDLATTLGGSSYFRIGTMYGSSSGEAPNGGLIFGGAVNDLYSRGATLSDTDVRDIVVNQLDTGGLPQDTRGIYVVLATPDVWASSGLDVSYCAFHDYMRYIGTNLGYVFVGSPARAPSLCSPQQLSPNGNFNADAMASLLAAELFNTITDPDRNAWYDRLGLEAADKCAWNYGTTYQTANGARANIKLGQRDFLLQQLWVPGKGAGYCALAAPAP